MKALYVWICLLSLFKPAFASAQYSYYVDPLKGNDKNKGTSINKAFKTITRARNAVRIVNKAMADNINVYLKGGVYQLDSTLRFFKRDGGTNGYSVIYQPYNCEVPLISGGVKVSNWSLHDQDKNIYKAFIDPRTDSRQLYVNGVRAIRARSIEASDWVENGDGYDCPEEVENWKNVSGIEVVSFMVWKCHRGPVASVENGHAKMAQPYWDNLHVQYGAPAGWIENAYELLDTEGEWYLDRSAGTLYYKPRVGENMLDAEVVLSKQERLLSCTDVQNLEVRGITFAHATWLTPNSTDGFSCHQADQILSNQTWKNLKQIPGNIFLERCNNIKINSCSFEHLGATALQLSKGCKSNFIYNNRFVDISGSAISVGSLNDSFPSPLNQVSNNVIDNNYISKAAVEFLGSVGIIIGYTNHTVVTHNEIRNLPYTGISVGWGWSNTQTTASDNEISYNLIDSVMTVMEDGGAIYTLSAQRGTQVHHNYIKNELNEHAALYADEGSSYMRFHHNVLDNIFRWINLWSLGSLSDTVDYNYYNNDRNIFSGTNCIIQNNAFIENEPWPIEALQIMKSAGRVPVEKCVYDNFITREPSLKVYPIPTSDIVQVRNDRMFPENYRVEVYDLQGRLLKVANKDKSEIQFSLDFRNYAPGMYFLRIVSGSRVYHNKIVKQ